MAPGVYLHGGGQGLQVRFPVQVGRHHEALAAGGRGGEQHEVAGELVVVVHPDNVAHPDLLAALRLQGTASGHLHLAVINLAVTLVSAVVLVTLTCLPVC